MWLNMAFAVYRSRRRSVTLYRLLYTVWVKEHRRFYQIKSRSQAGANIRLFSRSKIKMIAINSRTSAHTLPILILLYGYEEIKSDSYTSTDNEIQNICTKSLFGYRFTLFFFVVSSFILNSFGPGNFIATYWFTENMWKILCSIDHETIDMKNTQSTCLIWEIHMEFDWNASQCVRSINQI